MRIGLKALKAVSRAASKERGRYAIDGVHLTEAGLSATDGRMLLCAPHEADALGDGEHVTPRIVALDSVKAWGADKRSKRAGWVDVASNGALTYHGDAGEAIPALAVDGNFPDVAGVIPTDDRTGFKVAFSCDLLAALCAAGKDLDGDKPCIVLEFRRKSTTEGDMIDATAGVGVRFSGSKVTGVIMPMSE